MEKKLNNLLSFSDFEKNWKPQEQKKTKKTDIGLDIIKENVSEEESKYGVFVYENSGDDPICLEEFSSYYLSLPLAVNYADICTKHIIDSGLYSDFFVEVWEKSEDGLWGNSGEAEYTKEVENGKIVSEKLSPSAFKMVKNFHKPKIHESVRHGVFPYFRINKDTLKVETGIADNDLAEDAINWPREREKSYQWCSGNWSVSMCESKAEEALELLKSGKTVDEMDKILGLGEYEMD